MENVLEMMKTGHYHHRHPGYPGLHFYLQMIPATAHYLAARAGGEAESLRDLPREGFYRAARRTTLLAGWLTALAVFWVGRPHYGRWAAAVAGSLLALSPLSIRVSNVVSPDLLLMLFAAVALGLSLRAVNRPERGSFLAAGVSVGLATAIKYTGALLFVPYLASWLLSGTPRRAARGAALGVVAALVSFALASPYTFLDFPHTYRGLTMHVSYYQVARVNPLVELSSVLAFQGLGLPAALAALAGAGNALARRERNGAVLLSFPAAYLFVFSFFGRAFPRHAVVLLPALSLLAANVLEVRAFGERLRAALIAVLLASPIVGGVRLGLAARRPSAAEQAARWIEENLPAGSAVLADQYTPRLDPSRFRVHRLQVDERVFPGNYQWVLHSGYPPGLSLEGLRATMRFEPRGSLGTGIVLYKVPDRATLMGVTLARQEKGVEMGAGETPYFGEGWEPPEPWAFGTSRLSRGAASEIFFVLEGASGPLKASFRVGAALVHGEGPAAVELRVNACPAGSFEVPGEGPEDFALELPGECLKEGLNRLEFSYSSTYRRDRRHRETAVRFYLLSLRRL